jgi:Ca2+-binding EF-hand superfamily protein
MSYSTIGSRSRRLAIVALACTAFVSAHAQMKGDFDAADSNHDGRVTFEEFAAYAKQQLAGAGGRKARKFRQLSAEQQTAALRKRFDQADHAHRGYLDRSDWNAPRA